MLSWPIIISVLLTQPTLSFSISTDAPVPGDFARNSSATMFASVSMGESGIQPVTTEYDEILENWQKGKQLSLKHTLFQLNRVHSGDGTANQIVFTGESFGDEGVITLTFYTLEGDLVHVPVNHIRTAHVDRQRTNFSVGAIIPSFLRGREGAVQITFSGTKRAAFLVKVKF